MSTFDWTNVLMDEEQGLPVPAAKEDLPDENEKKGEDNGQDSEAAGALSEDDDPKGMKDVPRGEDPNTGDKPEDYDDVMNLFTDEDDSEKKEDEEEESEGEKKEEAAEGEDEDGKEEKKEEEKKEEGTKDIFDTFFNEEGGLPVPAAKEDLPDENEKEGEDNGFDSPASGDLPEDDDPDGMKDVPRGEDPITHMTSKEYDDLIDFYRDEDEEEKKDDDKEEKEDKEEKKEAGEDKGSDDDGASEDAPVEGDGDKEVKDFADFFFDSVGEETPDADGAGADLKPADPVDGDGKKIDPIGDPDLPSNLTEPVLVPADDPGTKDELLDTFRQDVRFGFGDF